MMPKESGNGSEANGAWLPFTPEFGKNQSFSRLFHKFALAAWKGWSSLDRVSGAASLARLRSQPVDYLGIDSTPLRLAMSVLLDLLDQGWELKVDGEGIHVRQPQYAADSRDVAKDKMKRALLRYRDEQLSEKANREFVVQMETRRLGPRGWVSIFSLMRDGRELAAALDKAQKLGDEVQRLSQLNRLIQPYLEFVTEGALCPHTHLRLVDIWRYFRHTWSTAYKSTPGRRMMFLVRDAGAPMHPVIGIGALSSSVVQLTCRDKWIGWHPETFVGELVSHPTKARATWILRSLRTAIRDVYLTDLIEGGTISKDEIRAPTARVIKRLLGYARREMLQHHRFPKAADIKALQSGHGIQSVNWKKLSGSCLYKAKRAKALSRLLQARMDLQAAGLQRPSVNALSKALQHGRTKRAIATVLREVKAKNVGVCMMDISVCGSVAPYNALLGGKLVSLLAASPQVIEEYRRRYRKVPSIIASSIKGKAMIRRPQLVLLGTTSLYATGSSQYNRIRVPGEAVGGAPGAELHYLPLGETLGFGSFHFSKETLELIENLVARSKNGRRVNSIFGEGVNPRLRKIRLGFDTLGLPEGLLKHGNPRLVYMVPLASNFREVLLGQAKRPRYLLPTNSPPQGTRRLAEHWIRRWLLGRINREGILDAVREHTLDYPIAHGARVRLPDSTDSSASSLFEEVTCLPDDQKV